MTQKEQFCWKI